MFFFFFSNIQALRLSVPSTQKEKKKNDFHEPVIQYHKKPTTTTQSLSLVISFMKPRIDQYDYWPVGQCMIELVGQFYIAVFFFLSPWDSYFL